jgi:cytidylate kinase
MYRAVTLAAMQAHIDMSDEDKLLEVIEKSEFQFSVTDGKMVVCINGHDVTEQIRSPRITANARHIASRPQVRSELVQMQRRFAADRQKIVTEGRDQGTVAFPDADIKFYLVADSAVRAKRRQADLRAKGVDKSLKHIQKAIEDRDRSDQNRTVGPLKPAEDAVIIDTTDLSIEGVVEKLLSYVKGQSNSRKS